MTPKLKFIVGRGVVLLTLTAIVYGLMTACDWMIDNVSADEFRLRHFAVVCLFLFSIFAWLHAVASAYATWMTNEECKDWK